VIPELETRSERSSKPAAKRLRLCKACNKEFPIDEYLDHVYDNPECYKEYLASEKKEMSKQ
jgi:hypothetical protein